jgi:phage tail tape-measure protein
MKVDGACAGIFVVRGLDGTAAVTAVVVEVWISS